MTTNLTCQSILGNQTCNIKNCIGCNNGLCVICIAGYQLNSNNLCIPQVISISNCKIISPNMKSPYCLLCNQGYIVNSLGLCSQISNSLVNTPTCSIYNCLYCSYNNNCSLCMLSWENNQGVCTTNATCTSPCLSCTSPTVCTTCITNFTLSNTNCISCTIAYCKICVNSN